MSRPFPPGREEIERLASRLAESLPANLRAMQDEIEANFRSVLAQGLAKLDLVTREEFEVQEAVLARTREKLDALEAKVRALETGPP
ncbi:MAG TPA: accessory factor UbiK family protein [Woeseiaceae bacterium]|nr:accessory factor UbiK family protein [Woeseiaceae bacterium]